MSDAINLNGFEEQEIPFTIKTVLTCTVRLDRKTILETLHCRSIYLDGHYYQIPEQKLIECLRLKQFGETHLELERIPSKKQ